MIEERYRVGDKIKLTYTGFEKPQVFETEVSGFSALMPRGLELPLGSQGYVSYYLFSNFAERMRIEGDELVVDRL
tara:strand:- start:2859 stop:3083 length:225 start_codon:yes stop_codon:yes gene_type:complete